MHHLIEKRLAIPGADTNDDSWLSLFSKNDEILRAMSDMTPDDERKENSIIEECAKKVDIIDKKFPSWKG